jgi:serine/threonine protein kinase
MHSRSVRTDLDFFSDETIQDGSVESEGLVGSEVPEVPDEPTSRFPISGWSPRLSPRTHGSEDSPRTHSSRKTQTTTYGRHGDINPSNILWYDESENDESDAEPRLSGRLVLADFGQAELVTPHIQLISRNVAHSPTYRPPESDILSQKFGPSYDIWCLGCVFLEFVTWMLGGQSLLEDFSRSRLTPDVRFNELHTDTFFQPVRNKDTGQVEVNVKKAVTLVREPILL